MGLTMSGGKPNNQFYPWKMIDTLPTELIQDLLELLVAENTDSMPSTHIFNLHAIMSTCRRLRSISFDTFALWKRHIVFPIGYSHNQITNLFPSVKQYRSLSVVKSVSLCDTSATLETVFFILRECPCIQFIDLRSTCIEKDPTGLADGCWDTFCILSRQAQYPREENTLSTETLITLGNGVSFDDSGKVNHPLKGFERKICRNVVLRIRSVCFASIQYGNQESRMIIGFQTI
jgi:hypothetical protein